jgi:hypothetical protein
MALGGSPNFIEILNKHNALKAKYESSFVSHMLASELIQYHGGGSMRDEIDLNNAKYNTNISLDFAQYATLMMHTKTSIYAILNEAIAAIDLFQPKYTTDEHANSK